MKCLLPHSGCDSWWKELGWCENPSLFVGSKLASWGISCDKTLIDLLRSQMTGATMWQLTSLWQHLKAPSSRADCLGKRVLRSVYWWKIWPVTKLLQLGTGKLGNVTIVSCEKQDADGHPCSLLSAGKARKMGTKEFLLRSQSQKLPLQGELTQPLWIWAVTPKTADSTTLEPLKRGHHRHGRCHRHCQQNNNAQQSTTTEDQWLNYKTTLDPWWWLSPSCWLQRLVASSCLSFLSPSFPSPLP